MKQLTWICNKCAKEIHNEIDVLTFSNIANDDVHFCSINCIIKHFTLLQKAQKTTKPKKASGLNSDFKTTPSASPKLCPYCLGTGKRYTSPQSQKRRIVCPECKGTGKAS